MPFAEKSVEINASAEKAFEIITDFEKYPEFLNEVKKVEIVKKTAKKAVVKFQVKFMKTFNYTLEFQFKKPTEVKWHMTEGDFKSNTGYWRLEEKGKNKTLATYGVEMDFGFFVPKRILNSVVGSALPGMLDRFKKRIESLT